MMKISLRELFCTTTVAAVLLSWWVDRLALSREVERLRANVSSLEAERQVAHAGRDEAHNQLKMLNDRLQSDLDRWQILQRMTVSEEDLRRAVAGSRAQFIACGAQGSSIDYVWGPFGESASTVRICYHFEKGKLHHVTGEHSGHDEHVWRDRFRFERRDDNFERSSEPREELPRN